MLEKLRRITEEQTLKMIYMGLAILLISLPVPQLFLPEDNRAIAMQATILMFALFFFLFIIVVEGLNKRFQLKGCDITVKCILGLVLIGAVSVILSRYKFIALYGYWVRYEGLFTLLAYYSIYLVSTLLRNKKYRRNLILMFLALGCVVAVLGMIQFFGIYTFTGRFPGMAYVPMRNPNFYASFSVLFVGVSVGGFLLYEKDSSVTHPFSWWNRWVWFGLILLGYAACISAASSVVYVGIIMILLMGVFLALVTKCIKIRWWLCAVVGFFAVFFLFNLIQTGLVANEFFSVWNQIEAEGSIFGDSVGTSRMVIWKQMVGLLPKYGLFGCGIDQLSDYCYEGYAGPNARYVDKAHNEYLNLWVTEGIFALVIYLIFLFALFIPGLKQFFGNKGKTVSREFDEISKIAFFAFFGYIAQAFFNISVVQVAPYFWMRCGLLYSRKRIKNEEKTDC